ncbi:hypothetical protein N9B68_01900 [bacterium]|nr:hypothetical protein [bacterium]
MALSYLTDINLNKNELQNAVIQKLATDPSSGEVAGWIIYNTSDNQLKVYDGSAWTNVGGDITGVNITAGTGLTGTVNTTSGQHTQTITLDDTAVTAASYGSSTAIPVITIDAQGRITAASTAAISSTLTISDDVGTPNTDGVTVGTDTLVFAGTTNEIDTLVSNNQVKIGLVANPTVSGNLIVSGNLTVSGTTTTVNTETINLADNIITLNSNEAGTPSENGGIEIERGTSDNVALRWNETSDKWQLTEDGSAYEEIQTIQNSTYSASIGDGSATSIAVTHGLGSQDVIVQLYDTSSLDTVYADVVRTSVNVVTITFSIAPTSNDIRVLVSKIG